MQFIVALNNSADTAKVNLLPTSLNTKLHNSTPVQTAGHLLDARQFQTDFNMIA